MEDSMIGGFQFGILMLGKEKRIWIYDFEEQVVTDVHTDLLDAWSDLPLNEGIKLPAVGYVEET